MGGPLAAFFSKHTFFDRWSDENRLYPDLVDSETAGPPDSYLSFFVEVDCYGLASTVGHGGTVDIEVLPHSAFKPSWWVDSMARSSDAVPHLAGSALFHGGPSGVPAAPK